MFDYQKEQMYLSLPREDAAVQVLRNGEDPRTLPVSVKIHTNLTDAELYVAKIMRLSETNVKEIEKHCVGGIWIRVSNLMFYGMKPHEVRLFILEQGFHPMAIPKAIKEYAGVSDENMLKANHLRHSLHLQGKLFWKNFHLAFLIKGMSKQEIMKFLIVNGYNEEDIPSLVLRRIDIDREKLAEGIQLMNNKTPYHKIAEILELN